MKNRSKSSATGDLASRVHLVGSYFNLRLIRAKIAARFKTRSGIKMGELFHFLRRFQGLGVRCSGGEGKTIVLFAVDLRASETVNIKC